MKLKFASIFFHVVRVVEITFSTSIFSRAYRKITKKELPEEALSETNRFLSMVYFTAYFAGTIVFLMAVVGVITTACGWLHPSKGDGNSSSIQAAIINPCDDEKAYDTAFNSGYEDLVIYFRNCPFVDAGSYNIDEKALKGFDIYANEYKSGGEPEAEGDAASRGMAIGTAILAYTMLHDTVKDGALTISGDPNAKVLITPWPDPQSYNSP